MPLHHFIATPVAESPVYDALTAHVQAREKAADNKGASQGIEIPFEQYYGIGTFPINTSDKLYKDAIIKSCLERYDFDLTPYYYPDASVKGGSSSQVPHLFDVTDLTATKSHVHRQRFRRNMYYLQVQNQNSHSSYFYIFIRPIQIIVITGLIGYALYLAALYQYGAFMDEEAPQEEQRGRGGPYDEDADY